MCVNFKKKRIICYPSTPSQLTLKIHQPLMTLGRTVVHYLLIQVRMRLHYLNCREDKFLEIIMKIFNYILSCYGTPTYKNYFDQIIILHVMFLDCKTLIYNIIYDL